jgi:iron complex transport system ATP-binding protein
MSDTPLLQWSRASVGYGHTEVVRGVELAVHGGEIVGLVGPNGAGKSTLLRSATGDSTLFAGTLAIAGRAASEFSARERASILGVVPQQTSAAFSLPARDFVEMGRNPHLPRFSNPGAEDIEAVERALAITDTARLADRPVDALSGGDLQRLALAQALAAQPRILLLDEPTSHLDLNHRMQVLDLVAELARDHGIAVLAVFHDLDLAARYSTRIAVVAEGAVGTADVPEQVITAENIRRVFGVRSVVGVDPVTGSVTVTPVLRDGAVAASRPGGVFLVGGSGTAAPLMRRLVLAGWRVSAGALNAGDADATLADALGVEYPAIAPFAPMDAAAGVHAAQLAAQADVVVVCDVPFGRGNIDNLLVAVRAGKPIVLLGTIEGRDFVGGAAQSYWGEAVEHGAVVVADFEAAFQAVSALAAAVASEPRG